MKAARILKPESIKFGEPHCFITLYDGGVGSYYYIEPTHFDDSNICFSERTSGDGLSINFMFNNEEVNVYRISGNFPKSWFIDFDNLSPEASRAFHLKGLL